MHLCHYEQLLQEKKLTHYVVFNLLTSFYREERLTALDITMVFSTAREVGNQNATHSTFFLFYYVLNSKQCTMDYTTCMEEP